MNLPILTKINTIKITTWLWMLSLIAIAILIYQVYNFWEALLVTPPEITQPRSIQPLVKPPSITRYHIFGSAPKGGGGESTLPLTLQGILADPKGRSGSAIISESGGTGQVYSVGQEVVTGVKVIKILPDQVILDHNGVNEVLKLPRPDLSASQSTFPELKNNEGSAK